MYQKYLGSYSLDDAKPFQFVEVGFFWGKGYDLYREFLPKGECHSIEIACIPPGPREEGKWVSSALLLITYHMICFVDQILIIRLQPWGNTAENNPRYQQYLDENRLHCGDGSDVNFLMDVWMKEMKRQDAPPLKVVIDDASHLAEHMGEFSLF